MSIASFLLLHRLLEEVSYIVICFYFPVVKVFIDENTILLGLYYSNVQQI